MLGGEKFAVALSKPRLYRFKLRIDYLVVVAPHFRPSLLELLLLFADHFVALLDLFLDDQRPSILLVHELRVILLRL